MPQVACQKSKSHIPEVVFELHHHILSHQRLEKRVEKLQNTDDRRKLTSASTRQALQRSQQRDGSRADVLKAM